MNATRCISNKEPKSRPCILHYHRLKERIKIARINFIKILRLKSLMKRNIGKKVRNLKIKVFKLRNFTHKWLIQQLIILNYWKLFMIWFKSMGLVWWHKMYNSCRNFEFMKITTTLWHRWTLNFEGRKHTLSGRHNTNFMNKMWKTTEVSWMHFGNEWNMHVKTFTKMKI